MSQRAIPKYSKNGKNDARQGYVKDSGWDERSTRSDIYEDISYENKRVSKGKMQRELKFHLSAEETLELLRNATLNERNKKLVKTVVHKTMRNKDNKSYQEQRAIRERYQATNGLVIKGIPFCFSRQECYDSILALTDKFQAPSGQVYFKGKLNMMQFMFPKKIDDSQTAFPIFSSAADRNVLWVSAKENYKMVKGEDMFADKKGLLWLTHPKTLEDHQVTVELVRNAIGEPQCDIENITYQLKTQQIDTAVNHQAPPPRTDCPVPGSLPPPLNFYQPPHGLQQTTLLPNTVPLPVPTPSSNFQPPVPLASVDEGSFMRQLLLQSHLASNCSPVPRPSSGMLFCSYESLSNVSGYSMSSAASSCSMSSNNDAVVAMSLLASQNHVQGYIANTTGGYEDIELEYNGATGDDERFCFNRQESTQTVVPRNYQRQDSCVTVLTANPEE